MARDRDYDPLVCGNEHCEAALSSTDIANGYTYCSEDCHITSQLESGVSSLWDDPERLSEEDE